jgi:reverse gyrase
VLDVRRWAEIRRKREVDGLSIHEIVRRTGHDRNTVRRALRREGSEATLLTRLLGGTSPAHAELLSYFFFQPQFVSEAIAAGRQDARELLASGDPWRTGPIERPSRS